jgi:hypothetical protein
MECDGEGFLYPSVDAGACTQCGLCRKACHALTPPGARNEEKQAFFGWHQDESIRRNSSSGGAYSAIAESLAGDAVFGAVHDLRQDKVRHVKLESSTIGPQRKSKYVFSDLENCYQQAESDLKQGRRVLFSGTPCQIAGLYAYLGQDYDTLFTTDLICHGVPSMKVLNEHLKHVSKERDIESVDFRPKSYGWSRHALLVGLEGRRYYLKDETDDVYVYAFLGNFSLRQCCYDCRYSNEQHRADITLADFWGVRQMEPSYNDEKGISLLILNTSKAKTLLPALRERMTLTPLERRRYEYVYVTHASYDRKRRKKYFTKLKTGGYAAAAQYVRGIAKTRKFLHFTKRALLEVFSR